MKILFIQWLFLLTKLYHIIFKNFYFSLELRQRVFTQKFSRIFSRDGLYIAENGVSVDNPLQDNPFKGTPQPIGMNIVVHPEVEKVKVLYQSLYYLYQHYQAISSKSKCHHGHATNLCQQNGLS